MVQIGTTVGCPRSYLLSEDAERCRERQLAIECDRNGLPSAVW